MVSYIGPIRGYQARKAELRAQEVTLTKLRHDRDRLRSELAGAQSRDAIEQRARELGYIKRGEQQYRVTNIEPPPDSGGGGAKGIGAWFPPVA